MVEQCAGGVGRGVAAGDELGQGLGGEFGAAEGVPGFVAGGDEVGEEVYTGGGVGETVVYARDGYAC